MRKSLIPVLLLGLLIALGSQATLAQSSVQIFFVACDTRSVINLSGNMDPGFDVFYQVFSGAGATGTPITSLRQEISQRDTTVANISHYFERLVGELTDKTRRDPKTKLMNFGRFMEQLESFLALEQRTRWCAVGLVDITAFKWYNDALGHAVGDRIIERVATILGEQIRSDDLIAQEKSRGEDAHERSRRAQDLTARFGGDEFCFLIPDLADYSVAWLIAERFRDAVERHDWRSEDPRLEVQPVKVDVGVVCLLMGPVHERRQVARSLARDLLKRADTLMYEAKGERASHAFTARVRIEHGHLADIPRDETT